MIFSWIGFFACLAFVVILNFICFFYLTTTLSINSSFNATNIDLPIQLPLVFYSHHPQTRSAFLLSALVLFNVVVRTNLFINEYPLNSFIIIRAQD